MADICNARSGQIPVMHDTLDGRGVCVPGLDSFFPYLPHPLLHIFFAGIVCTRSLSGNCLHNLHICLPKIMWKDLIILCFIFVALTMVWASFYDNFLY
jgi:hypothetical protein